MDINIRDSFNISLIREFEGGDALTIDANLNIVRSELSISEILNEEMTNR